MLPGEIRLLMWVLPWINYQFNSEKPNKFTDDFFKYTLFCILLIILNKLFMWSIFRFTWYRNFP